MPKSFSEAERGYIKSRLMEEAKLCLTQYGIKKTTVDELVNRVHIPKGTFYLFYQTKELLFFDVLCEFHDQLQSKLISEVTAAQGNINVEKLTKLILELYTMVADSFLLRLLTDGEIELLIRKLPPEIAEAHAEKDDFNVEKLLSLVPNLEEKNIAVFSAALRGVFLSTMHRHEIGEPVFEDALEVMIRGIVIQMFEGEAK